MEDVDKWGYSRGILEVLIGVIWRLDGIKYQHAENDKLQY